MNLGPDCPVWGDTGLILIKKKLHGITSRLKKLELWKLKKGTNGWGNCLKILVLGK